MLTANNLARQLCAEEFITMKGTQALVRKVVTTMHDKRDRQTTGSDLVLQDLLWVVAPVATKG